MNRGAAYQVLGELDKAIEDYNKAIEIREILDSDPNIHFDRNDLAGAFMNRGAAYQVLGELEQAKKDFTNFFKIVVDLLYHFLQSNNIQMAQVLLQEYQNNISQMIKNDHITNTEYIQRYEELLENKK